MNIVFIFTNYFHELDHGVNAAWAASSEQFGEDSRAAEASLDVVVDGLDLGDQGVVLLLCGASGAMSPLIGAARGNLQGPAHQSGRPLLGVIGDE